MHTKRTLNAMQKIYSIRASTVRWVYLFIELKPGGLVSRSGKERASGPHTPVQRLDAANPCRVTTAKSIVVNNDYIDCEADKERLK